MLGFLRREQTPPPAPFIVGVGRSGTTLLRLIFDSHPELALPPETGFIPHLAALAPAGEMTPDRFVAAVADWPAWEDYGLTRQELRASIPPGRRLALGDGIRAFYATYARRFSKPRWGDKTPIHCRSMDVIQQVLPEARFIHVIRDGRDVAVSVRPLWFAPGATIEALAEDWVSSITAARRLAAGLHHYTEVRYEDLVRDPWPQVRRLCAFVGLPYHPTMERFFERAPGRLAEHATRRNPDGTVLVTHAERLHNQRFTMSPVTPERIGRHRTEMTADEIRRFDAVAGPLLRSLGYEQSHPRQRGLGAGEPGPGRPDDA